ncbi:MAG: class II aldolase/adducin family protein [Alphaproteobacteria bacterium]|nr:class II aldolase/adducin family protein [Alphaproteobacteria bacterium]MBU2379539.1 class II aldolase/adducin family protein [Alphaproteobacteria bacterium]
MTTASKVAPGLRDGISPEEWAARVDLAAAYRLVALYGWDDLIFTHLSARVPGPEHHFLINDYQNMFEEMTASNLIKIDLDGNKVDDVPGMVNSAGFIIHSALHMAREDANAVIHLHTPHGQAVSAMKEGLTPHTQTAMIAHHGVAYHDHEGIATELGERERIVADMSDKGALILRNHGTLTVGNTVAEAFLRMYFLERACQAQVLMLAAGRDGLNEPPEGVPDIVKGQTQAPVMRMAADYLAWPALLRKLDRIDPSYRN